jgi:dienelactone hydrolase
MRIAATAFLLALCASFFAPSPARAGENVSYSDGPETLEGYWVPAKCAAAENAPVVMIVHQWKGLGANEKQKAEALAGHCYNVFAIDMYGKGIRPQTNEDAAKEAAKYKNDPESSLKRINAAIAYIHGRTKNPSVPLAALGYCFGGSMVLDLARSGADLKAVVSFHGGLTTKRPQPAPGTIRAAVQVHNGADDPTVPPDVRAAFMEEMNKADADWEFSNYAHAVHAFTDPNAGSDPSKGVAYNEKADRRSWAAMLAFLAEAFAGGKKD